MAAGQPARDPQLSPIPGRKPGGVITWDEGEGGTSNDCATNTTDVGCHVATLVITPSTTPGTQSSTLFNHYSLLGTTEDLLGLPRLGPANGAGSMASAFGL